MVTGDGAYIKKINRSIILQTIVEHGRISRADLSKVTGLNKATISVQVAALLAEKLILETEQEHRGLGRKPIMLTINSKSGYVLGIDLDYKEIQFAVSDLQGHAVESDFISLETTDYKDIVQILAGHIKNYQKKYAASHFGLVRIVIGIHGTVSKDEVIYFVPKYQWHNKDLKQDLLKEVNAEIAIENNANLSSYAEKTYQYPDSGNLLTIILTSGIGTGNMVDGKLQTGYDGYAGEMGHMIIVPGGKACTCGNHGCWELYASEPALFTELEEVLHTRKLTAEEVRQLLIEENPAVSDRFDQFITYLSYGLNNVINLYNPETIVLNSEILSFYPDAVKKIENNLTSSVSQYREILISRLGRKACVMGACALAIERFLEVPALIFPAVLENNFEKNTQGTR